MATACEWRDRTPEDGNYLVCCQSAVSRPVALPAGRNIPGFRYFGPIPADEPDPVAKPIVHQVIYNGRRQWAVEFPKNVAPCWCCENLSIVVQHGEDENDCDFVDRDDVTFLS